MPRFSNIPIVWRVVLSPLLLLTITTGVLWWTDSTTERSLAALTDGDQRALQSMTTIYATSATRLRHVDELVATLYRAHSDAMRHISLSGSGLEPDRLAGIRAEVAKNLGRARQLVAEAADGRIEGQTASGRPAPSADIKAALDDYEQAVTELDDMAEFDRLMAIGLIPGTETKFQVVDRALLATQATEWAAAQNDAAQLSRESADAMGTIRQQTMATRANSWIVAVLSLTAGLVASLLIGRGITRPLASMTAAMTALAHRDLAAGIPGANRRDEVGRMAQALQVFKDNMVMNERLAAQQAEERQRAEAEKRAALTDMADTIETETEAALTTIHRRATAMATTADAMSASADRTGASAHRRALPPPPLCRLWPTRKPLQAQPRISPPRSGRSAIRSTSQPRWSAARSLPAAKRARRSIA